MYLCSRILLGAQYYILHVARLYFSCGLVSMCRKCLSHSIWTILYLGLHLRSHLPGCLFLKYTLSPILKDGGCLSIGFCAVLKQFSSNVFLAMAKASLWVQDLAFHSLNLPKIIAWALEADVGVNLDLFHKLSRRVFLLWQGLVPLYKWQEPD